LSSRRHQSPFAACSPVAPGRNYLRALTTNEPIKNNHYNAYAFIPDSDDAAAAAPALAVVAAAVSVPPVTAKPDPVVAEIADLTPLPRPRPKFRRH
jgi:hypothetical protein